MDDDDGASVGADGCFSSTTAMDEGVHRLHSGGTPLKTAWMTM
jgi:hypothetical protein